MCCSAALLPVSCSPHGGGALDRPAHQGFRWQLAVACTARRASRRQPDPSSWGAESSSSSWRPATESRQPGSCRARGQSNASGLPLVPCSRALPRPRAAAAASSGRRARAASGAAATAAPALAAAAGRGGRAALAVLLRHRGAPARRGRQAHGGAADQGGGTSVRLSALRGCWASASWRPLCPLP